MVGISRVVCRLAIIAIFLAGCATARPWTKEEKIMLGASCLAAAADAYTTLDGLHNGAREMNPIMGEYPSDGQVIITMVATQVITILIAHYWSDLRDWILGVKTGANAACTFNNIRVNR